MKDIIITLIFIIIGTITIAMAVLTPINNNILINDLYERTDSLSKELKQLRYEMDSVNTDLLNMF